MRSSLSSYGLILGIALCACRRDGAPTTSGSSVSSADEKKCGTNSTALAGKAPITERFNSGVKYCLVTFNWGLLRRVWIAGSKDSEGTGGCAEPEILALINVCSDPNTCQKDVGAESTDTVTSDESSREQTDTSQDEHDGADDNSNSTDVKKSMDGCEA